MYRHLASASYRNGLAEPQYGSVAVAQSGQIDALVAL